MLMSILKLKHKFMQTHISCLFQ